MKNYNQTSSSKTELGLYQILLKAIQTKYRVPEVW